MLLLDNTLENYLTNFVEYKKSRYFCNYFSFLLKSSRVTSINITYFFIFAWHLTSFYLMYSNSIRKIHVDLNINKKFDLKIIIYHVKTSINWNEKKYSSKKTIKSILFLNRLFFDAKIKYWSIELKLNDIVWVFRKIRHFVDFFLQKFFVVFTNHEFVLNIVKQINMTIISIDKLNFRIVKISNYIQRFDLEIRHKSNKLYIVSNTLSRFVNINTRIISNDENEFDALFIIVLIKMKKDFHKRIVVEYLTNLNWKKICEILNKQNENNIENDVQFLFYRQNKLIFRFDDFIIDDYVFESRRLYIFSSIIQNILIIAYNDNYSNFARCYEKITFIYYIRDLTRYFRKYLKYCSKYQMYQTRQHQLYDFLQFIFILFVSFYIVTIDFVLILSLSLSSKSLNCLMSINCKFFKRILLILEKNTHFVAQ